jgi:hypothetical protein
MELKILQYNKLGNIDFIKMLVRGSYLFSTAYVNGGTNVIQPDRKYTS